MKPSMHGKNSSLGFIEAVCLTKVLKDDTQALLPIFKPKQHTIHNHRIPE